MIINDRESALSYIDALSGESLDTVYKHLSRAIDDQLICISLCRDNMHETIARHREAIAALSCAMVEEQMSFEEILLKCLDANIDELCTRVHGLKLAAKRLGLTVRVGSDGAWYVKNPNTLIMDQDCIQ